MSTFNLNQYSWDKQALAGRDRHGNNVTVEQLVAAIDGLQQSLHASSQKVREQNQQINELENGLNHTLARLNEQNAA